MKPITFLRQAVHTQIIHPLQRKCQAWIYWLLVITLLVQIPAPALVHAAPKPAPMTAIESKALSPDLDKQKAKNSALDITDTGTFQVYDDFLVNCDDPQYPEVELPITLAQKGIGGHYKQLYICTDGGTFNLAMHAAALGYGSATMAKLECMSGPCSGFYLEAPQITLWDNGLGCKWKDQTFTGNVTFPAGKYRLTISADSNSDFWCSFPPVPHFYEYTVGLTLPGAENPFRTLAKEEACLANNPQDLGFVGDPVNTYSGNFTYSVEDVFIPTQGLPLYFERTYNSLDSATDGPLGHGWTHNYNISLSFEGVTVTLRAPRGSHLPFTDNGDGTFTPGPGVRATLAEEGSGGYRLVRADRMVYHFDAQGRLTGLEDNNGNLTMLEYDELGHLWRVMAPGTGIVPRMLEFTYTTQNRIRTIRAGEHTITYGYHLAGDLGGVTDRRGYTTVHMYFQRPDSDLHFLSAIVDPNENPFNIAYDDEGRVESQTDAQGNTFTYAYYRGKTIVTDPRDFDTAFHYAGGLLSAIVNPLEYQSHFTYDDEYNRISVTDPSDHTTHFKWNPGACKVSVITNTLGYTTTFIYDDHNNLISQADTLGRSMEYAYDEHDNPATITDTLGHTAIFTYDSCGQLQWTTDPRGHETYYEHTSYGDLRLIRDPLGNETIFDRHPTTGEVTRIEDANDHFTWFRYDAEGNLTESIDHLDGKVTYEYGGAGELLAVTDQRGNTTRYAYDELYQLAVITDANGYTSTYAYDAAGNLTQATDPNGHTVTYTFDALNRLTAVTDPLGHTTYYGYDPVGNLTVITDANGYTTTYAYDDLDRLTAASDPLSHTTYYVYDKIGNLTVITDANGYTTTYAYDDLNRLAVVTDALNGATRYQYNEVGNLIQVLNARGYTTTYKYDALNRPEKVTDFLLHTWNYDYDPAGNLSVITDANDVAVNYVYDALNRLERIDYPFPQDDIYFTYDAVGNRRSMSDSTDTTIYDYDDLNRLTHVTAPGNRLVSYVYDPAGNRTRLTYPTGQWLDYTYDEANRLATVSSPQWPTISAVYTYDPAGRLVDQRDADGRFVSTFIYDAAGRLLSLMHEDRERDITLASFAYDHDDVGNRIWASETLQGKTVTIDYDYDKLYRLTSATYSDDESYAYSYDAVGNRLSETVNGSTTLYTYDEVDRLTQADPEGPTWRVYNYDANGSRVYERLYGLPGFWPRDKRYDYDAANRLIEVEERDPYTGLFERVAAFGYNGDGLRVSRQTDETTTPYVWDVAAPLPQVLSEDEYAYTYGLSLLSRQPDWLGRSLSYRLDGLGSVRLTIDDASGGVLDNYRYAPFGGVMAGGTSNNVRRFTGEMQDPDTDFIYLRARYYDPYTGRFLTQDPFPGLAVDPQTLNPYAYSLNNPVNLSDPSGEFPWVAALAYGAGYLGYNFFDSRVHSGLGRKAMDVFGFLTGYESIQQDLEIIAGHCSGWCKAGAILDMAFNATSGISMFSGLGKGLFHYSTLGKRLVGAPQGNIPITIGGVGKRITLKQVSTELTEKAVLGRTAKGLFRIPHTCTILAHTGEVSGQALAHEIAHVFQEFGTTGLEHSAVQWLHKASIVSTSGNLIPFLLPTVFGYVLNPVEVQAAWAGLGHRGNLEFALANFGIRLISQLGLDRLCK